MKTLHGISIVLIVVLCLSTAGIAADTGNQSTAAQGSQPQSGSAASTQDTAKKSEQSDVQSRGLLQKKKKKKVGGSAGHSQPTEPTDVPAR
jgi:hypothetical protein